MIKTVVFHTLLLFLFHLLLISAFSQTPENKEFLGEKLAFAARLCQTGTVKKMLAEKVSPDSRDRFDQPALLLAFRCDLYRNSEKVEKTWELVKMLVEAGADINVRNEFGVTPFLLGEIFDYVHENNIRLVEGESKPRMQDYLASKGAKPDVRDIHGRNGFQHFHNADTGETRGEQVWRHIIEGIDNSTATYIESQFALAKEKVLEANKFRFGKYNASLAMAAVYYDAFNLTKIIGSTLPNIVEDVDETGENIFFYGVRADNPFRFGLLVGRTIYAGNDNLPDAEANIKFQQTVREHLKRKNKNGLTPLEMSYQTDSILFRGFVYKHLENPNEIDKEGLTPLMHEIENKNLPLIFALLTNEKINPNLAGKNGSLPLIYAVERNDHDLVTLLLSGIKTPTMPKGKEIIKIAAANINLSNKAGKTALMIAAENGNSVIVKTLLRNGSNALQKDKKGETALILARKNNRSAIYYRLASAMKIPNAQPISGTIKSADNSKKPTALMTAANNGDLTNLQKLLKSGAKIDETDTDGKTALFYAILNDEIYAVRALIAANANVNHAAGGNATPLMTAARFGRDQIITLLQKAGAKPNEQDKFGKTALAWATENDIETVLEMLKTKPNLHIKDEKGETAIVQTVQKGNFNAKEIVAALLKAGANANDSDANNNNTICIAAKTKQDNLFVLLLKAGANPFQEGDFGFTTFTELNNYAPDIEESNRVYNLVYENTLPKYLPKTEKQKN